MSRVLFWILLAALIFFALRSKLRTALRNQEMQARRQRQPDGAAPVAIEDMTSCAQCGLHFPVSEAVRAGGRDYCSPAHVPPGPR